MAIFKDRMDRPLSNKQAGLKIINRLNSYIFDLELLIVDLAGWIPSHIFRKLIYILAGMKIGRRSYIHMGARFFYTRGIKIGDGTIIGERAFLDGRNPLEIGNHVDIASEVTIYNSEHDTESEDFQA